MPRTTVTNEEFYREIELRKEAEAERDEWERRCKLEYKVRMDTKARVTELEAALRLALMHLEDERAIAAVRAALDKEKNG